MNNTNTDSEKEFVLFFFNDFFGIRIINEYIHSILPGENNRSAFL